MRRASTLKGQKQAQTGKESRAGLGVALVMRKGTGLLSGLMEEEKLMLADSCSGATFFWMCF